MDIQWQPVQQSALFHPVHIPFIHDVHGEFQVRRKFITAKRYLQDAEAAYAGASGLCFIAFRICLKPQESDDLSWGIGFCVAPFILVLRFQVHTIQASGYYR